MEVSKMDSNLGAILNQYRKDGIGCDMAFRLEEEIFPAHKSVLMARMQFFRAFFLMSDESKPLVTLDCDLLSASVLEEILQYIYTWKLDFTINNVDMICIFAKYFRFQELLDKSLEYLRELIDNENVVIYLHVSHQMGFKIVERKCFEHLMANILPRETLGEMIRKTALERMKNLLQYLQNVSKHEEMFFFITEYIRRKPEHREALPGLLQSIPMTALPHRFLTGVVAQEKMVQKSAPSMRLLNDALSRRLVNETLFVLGGTDSVKLSSVSTLTSEGSWARLTPMPYQVSHFGCVTHRQKIYILGGLNERDMRELDVYEVKTREWKSLSPMPTARQCPGVAVLNGYIYVAGGRDFEGELDDVERYNIRNNAWETVPDMNKKRFGLELVQLGGYLYAIGGQNKKDPTVSTSAERFDPITGKWSLISGLHSQYCWFGASVFKDKIYIVGNKSFEFFDPETDQWTKKEECPENGSMGMNLVVFGGKLMAVGGRAGDEPEQWKALPVVSSWDETTGKWVREKDMADGRWNHAAVVVQPEEL